MIDFIELHLNGQISYWITIRARELSGSFVRPLFFLYICITTTEKNDLKSNVKIFADDTSLLSEIFDPLETSDILKMT